MAPNKEKKLKTAIVVLSVLLAISVCALVGVTLRLRQSTSAVVTDNLITTGKVDSPSAVPAVRVAARDTNVLKASNVQKWQSTDETILKLYDGQSYSVEPFLADNMFPGDTVEETYCVQVSHKGPVVVHFEAPVRKNTLDEEPLLDDVLECQIFIEGELRYEGLMADINNFLEVNPTALDYTTPATTKATTTNIEYTITAGLDTSVGNPYQDKHLIADFKWWVMVDDEKETSDTPPTSRRDDTDDPDVTYTTEASTTPTEIITDAPTTAETPEESGQLVKPPKTGDNTIMVFGAVLAVGLFLIILLLKRRKEEEHES